MYEFICKYCKQNFSVDSFGKKGSHIGNCKDNPNKKASLKIGAEKTKLISLARKNFKETEYYKNPKLCNCCSKIIPYDERLKKYCNSSCSAKITNKLKPKRKNIISEEGKENIRRATRKRFNLPFEKEVHYCIICSKQVTQKQKYCSKQCRSNDLSFRKKASERMIERFIKNPDMHPNRLCAGKVSYPENMLKQYFIQNNLIENKDFICQFRIERYFIDFYLPKINLCIEVDGKRWHTDKEKEEKRELVIKRNHGLIRFDAYFVTKKLYEKQILEIINSLGISIE